MAPEPAAAPKKPRKPRGPSKKKLAEMAKAAEEVATATEQGQPGEGEGAPPGSPASLNGKDTEESQQSGSIKVEA